MLTDYGVRHPRMLECRLWYFESVLDSNHAAVAESGFVSISQKAAAGSRLRIEARFLLAVALLRQRKIAEAKAHFRSVLKDLNKISSANTRRLLQRRIFERFEEEAILTELIGVDEKPMIAEEIHNAAILLVKSKNEDELYEYLASALPGNQSSCCRMLEAMVYSFSHQATAFACLRRIKRHHRLVWADGRFQF